MIFNCHLRIKLYPHPSEGEMQEPDVEIFYMLTIQLFFEIN